METFESNPEVLQSAKEIGPIPARIFAAFTNAVFVKFKMGDKDEYGLFIPGRMYVNGSVNLLSYTRTQSLVRAVLDTEMDFRVHVRELKDKRSGSVIRDDSGNFCFNGWMSHSAKNALKKMTNKDGKGLNDKMETVYINYAITAIYTGNDPPVFKGLNQGKNYPLEDKSFEHRLHQVHRSFFGEQKISDSFGDAWFLISDLGSTGFGMHDKELTPVKVGVRGTVAEIFRPFGGLIEVESAGLVAFYRMTLHCHGTGKLLGFVDRLEDHISVGDSVTVDLATNQLSDGSLHLSGFPGKYVAAAVYKGASAELGQSPEAQPVAQGEDGGASPENECHKIRVFELYEDPSGSGAYYSGLATIQMSEWIKTGNASASMIGEFCTFSGSVLTFMGATLAGVDLSYVLTPGDEISCQLTMFNLKQGRAQYSVKCGYVGCHFGPDLKSKGQTTAKRNSHKYIVPEFSKNHKKTTLKKNKISLDFLELERVMLRKVPPKAETPPPGMAIGRIISLEPAENNETVAKGTVQIEVGRWKGKIVNFNRTKTFVEGINIQGCDLLYLVTPFEQVYVDIVGMEDYPEGLYVSQKCLLGSPTTKVRTDTNPMTGMEAEERTNLILFLDRHNLKYQDFLQVMNKTANSRYFIPFPRDQLSGRVVGFDMVRGNKYGCTSGTINIDQGSINLDNPKVGDPGVKSMAGVKVTFHRTNFWVFGRKMAKADLSYVVQPNQRVQVECAPITDKDREVHTALPANIHYRATVVWIGPSRPRNDKDDPNRNDVGIFDWLGKRGLNIKQFTKLTEGHMTPHGPHELDHRNFFLPKVDGANRDGPLDREEVVNNPELLPVLRHGPVIAHIVDTALASSGPKDPRLFHLIENDMMAQAAHHVSEALKTALAYYREKSMSYSNSPGFGPHTAPMPHKRPYDDFGGGPSKRGRGGYNSR